MINNKFSQVTQDSDTKITYSEVIELHGFDAFTVLHEKWIWDGIEAQSYIFYNEDIKELTEKDLLKKIGKIDATYSKGEIYTFINFDFKH